MPTPAQRRRHEACRDVSREINPIKSRLIDQLSRLDEAEARDASNRLGKIIADLEGWQGRFA
jgi:hypothetical protein